ncbi:MAG TPA: penicillin-binding transpeptidase domain-containing protein, partial [Pseudobdellovibrionaceae bacterium]|nr:penicillin-binding transpeptidase domain-containing protein [Pseudobdellovibrionaceae bacterium]
MNTYVSNPDEAKEYLPRYKFLYGIIIGTFIIFTLRLWFLQIFSGAELREFSEKNRIKQNKILAPRGLILDREGRVLVENLPGFEAVLFPQYLKNLEQTTQALAPILGVEPEKLAARIQKSRKQNGPFAVIKLKDNLTREEVFRLKRIWLETPGLEIRESIVRHYPLGLNGAQMFGYVGEISKKQIENLNKTTKSTVPFVQGDIVGKSGIEELLEQKIRGIDGMNVIQVDAHGRELPFKAENLYSEQLKDQEPVHGHNSVLTIDRDLQEVGYKSMLDNKRIGAMVAMQSNGEILAWVSTPSFDPNEFSVGISPQNLNKILSDPFKPLLNRVHREHNSPGSTFKPLIALAALQEKIITPTTLVSAPGVFMFGNRPYHDHLKQG